MAAGQGVGSKAGSRIPFFPASALDCYFYSLLSHLKLAWVERARKCLSCSRAVFLPSFFHGYSGPGILGLFSWPTQGWEQKENPPGTSLEGERRNFGDSHLTDPFFVRFYSHGSGVRVPWFGQEKGTSRQGMSFS